MLLDEVQYHAQWRAEGAGTAPPPHAQRCRRSAEALQRLHASLSALPPQDPRWQRYAATWGRMRDSDGLALGEAQREVLRGYGYASAANGQAAQFLEVLLAALGAARGVRLHGPPPRVQ